MNVYSPFQGVVFMPDKIVAKGTSQIMLGDGRVVALVDWHRPLRKARFEILDPATRQELARGAKKGRRFELRGPQNQPLLRVTVGRWRTVKGATIVLGNGQALKAKGSLARRRFDFTAGGQAVAQIRPTTGVFTFRPDSYEFAMRVPAMSVVEAVALAQLFRLLAKKQRQQRAAQQNARFAAMNR